MYSFPEKIRRAYENSPLSFVYYQNIDGNPVPILASEGFCRNLGRDIHERERTLDWLSTGLYERIHPDDVGMVSKITEDFLNQKGAYDIAFRCKLGGKYVWIHGLGGWQTMEDGQELAVICYANITRFRDQMFTYFGDYDLLRKDSFYTDPLTGLPNINYLHEYSKDRVEVLFFEGKTPYLVYTDIYSMASYNNQYGFGEGDKLLCLVAQALRLQFPQDLLIRGANDHFFMITDLEDPEELTARLEAANAYIKKNALGNTLGIRSGISRIRESGELFDVLDRARKAIREINDDMNLSCAFFSREMDERYWRERYVIENFEIALEHDWIKVYYQGIMNIVIQRVDAFEALARWVDPVRGTISPGEFIPVLSRYHLLYKLDLYMLEAVCKEVLIRHENQLPLFPVSINFSRQDFDHVDVAEALEHAYKKYGMEKYVDRKYFIIEVTEQDIAQGTEQFRGQLRKIHEMGYQLWLDDFGSGYSAINMFSQYDFDLVKFDMELLHHLDDKRGVNRLILKEMVYLAKEIGMRTLVEGLENQDQYQFVEEIGCELVQGFYYFKPEPLAEILYRIERVKAMKECGEKNKIMSRFRLD